MFSDVYVRRVLGPCYANWKHFFLTDSFAVHRAHLAMLADTGVVEGTVAAAIKGGIEEIARDFEFPETIPMGTEDLYFVFEKELGRRIGEDFAGSLHTARSRNDMDTTVFRMFVRARLLTFFDEADQLFSVMQGRMIESGGGDPVILYTHGQPANVSTLAHYLGSMLADLQDCMMRVAGSLETVNSCSMGACAITTTGFPIDRDSVARMLGFGAPLINSYQAISTSHWLSAPAAALSAFLSDIGRFAADLSHKASCEVGILRFPDELVQISSIMPQKRNPVILEHIRIQASLALGILRGLEDLFRNVPYQDVNEAADAPVEEFSRAMDLATSCVELFREMASKVSVETERVGEIATEFGITSTELADSLVRDFGLSFREAHGHTSSFVRSGCRAEALRQSFEAKGHGPLRYTDSEIAAILTPENFIAVRNVPGGPGPLGMKRVLADVEKTSTALRKRFSTVRESIESGAAELARRYGRL